MMIHIELQNVIISGDKHPFELRSELSAHGTINDEIDRATDDQKEVVSIS